ncbi:MAG: SpoIIE family protein phosphatase [Bacteroidales bacterium]
MGYTVLLIDPLEKNLDGLNTNLSNALPDYIFFTINDYTNLNKQIINYSPDLIIIDIDHTATNNNHFLPELIQSVNVPVIAISQATSIDEIFNTGIISFIQKPVSDIAIVSAIKTAVKFISTFKSLEQKQNEIEIINKHIEVQHNNTLKQRDIITQKNSEIMADIRYASRIQRAILPNTSHYEELTNQHFIFHLPKSFVSGDFYWIKRYNDKLIFAVGDCTGHGVSGALMHMLGTVYLNSIITENTFKNASDILEQLRSKIMILLHQKGNMGETQDGMDIALCIVDCNNKTIEFAGANNPLYLIRNNELIEYKGDRMPVGIHINFNKSFTNHIIEIKSNDIIYLFSDGYADQFGGESGKKFRYKRFQDLLIEINQLQMYRQKEALERVFIDWLGSLDQVDDVLVFGFKIK